jgi:hypothetical protein
MPEVARGNAIEIGETVVRAGSKIEARDQVEQALMGAICNRDRQRFLVESFDVAGDQRAKQPAQGPLSGVVPAQGCEFLLESQLLLEGIEGPQAMMLLRKPCVQVVHVSLFKSWKKLWTYSVGEGLAPQRISHPCAADAAVIR